MTDELVCVDSEPVTADTRSASSLVVKLVKQHEPVVTFKLPSADTVRTLLVPPSNFALFSFIGVLSIRVSTGYLKWALHARAHTHTHKHTRDSSTVGVEV